MRFTHNSDYSNTRGCTDRFSNHIGSEDFLVFIGDGCNKFNELGSAGEAVLGADAVFDLELEGDMYIYIYRERERGEAGRGEECEWAEDREGERERERERERDVPHR